MYYSIVNMDNKNMEVTMDNKNMEVTFEEIIDTEYNRFYAIAFRLTGNHHDSQDVLQTAFLNAFRNLDKFQGKSKLSTWIYKIIVNESKHFLGKMRALPISEIVKREGITEEAFFGGLKAQSVFDDELIMDEMREKCLQGFLNCMSKNHRAAFLLKTITSLSVKEIAEVLDISIENAKVSIFRARHKIKEMLEDRCSLINPEKPCDCYLWTRYAKLKEIEIPKMHYQEKSKELKEKHFINLSNLRKIQYLYEVNPLKNKELFLKEFKKIALTL